MYTRMCQLSCLYRRSCMFCNPLLILRAFLTKTIAYQSKHTNLYHHDGAKSGVPSANSKSADLLSQFSDKFQVHPALNAKLHVYSCLLKCLESENFKLFSLVYIRTGSLTSRRIAYTFPRSTRTQSAITRTPKNTVSMPQATS